ncbi:MAG TPA: VWA domain-containing protein [Methanothrix sp.]|nr:VWA domain-containing protein [Methanothrix sp.]
MRKIPTMICLVAVALICMGPALGQNPLLQLGLDQVWGDDDNDADWYSYDAPTSPEGLADEGPLSGREEAGGIWIVDSSGTEKRTSLEIPMGAWARVMLAPSESGELRLFCRYPTGTENQLLAEEVEAGHGYSAWYQAEWPGDYEVWYSLEGAESDVIRFTVQEGWIAEEGMAAPGMAKSGGSGGTGVGAPVMQSYAATPAPVSPSIGLAAGGAKDVENFRENIEEGYLPLPTDVTYEGLFYDYYFETGQIETCEKLFCPSYSTAISKDPISGDAQRYLSVGLNSGITDFSRKKLNLVVVLDYSGSMGSPFSDYYYDQFGNKVEVGEDEGSSRTKMEIADETVVDLLGHLEDDDRFGLVLFSDDAYIVEPLTKIEDKDLPTLEDTILDIEEYSGTNMEAGMVKGSAAFGKYVEIDPAERENRIIFITDAMPNLGETGEGGLLEILEENADKGIYTTFIGVGVDFNTELVEKITKIRGANYYSVHSASDFKERMDEEFEFMVTPLVFDLVLQLDSPGYRIEKVYGSPEADEATGEIMKVNTLFPSKAEEGEVKGGIVLIKLEQISSDGNITLVVSYEDRNGTEDGDEAAVVFPEVEPDFYQNDGIRKAILLSRYADLLKNWMIDERKALESDEPVQPSVTTADGIPVPGPVELGEWERQSLPLTVSEPYRNLFEVFGSYFENESDALGDIDLQQEEIILDVLSGRAGEVMIEVSGS